MRGPVPRPGQYYQYHAKSPDGCGCGCIPGCTDATRLGYNRDAFFEDDSCGDVRSPGCTHPLASNFNAIANFDDGSCHVSACVLGNHNCHANATCRHVSPYHNTTHSCVCNPGFSDTDGYDDEVICELDYQLYSVMLTSSVSIDGDAASPGTCARAIRSTVAEVVQNAATSRTNVLTVQQSIVLDPYVQMLEVKVVLEGTT
jgi:hypothetical protein